MYPDDLDNTANCPPGDRCERCGSTDDLEVMTADTPVGVLCAAVCGDCAETGGELPRMDLPTAVIRVLEHCEHLGIDADEMAAAKHHDEDGQASG
jgi:hypothetical protein